MKKLKFISVVCIIVGFTSVINAQTYTEKVVEHIQDYPVICTGEYVSGDITTMHNWHVNNIGEVVSDRWVNQGGELISNLGNVYRFISVWMDHWKSSTLNNGMYTETYVLNYKIVGKDANLKVTMLGRWVHDFDLTRFIIDRFEFEIDCH